MKEEGFRSKRTTNGEAPSVAAMKWMRTMCSGRFENFVVGMVQEAREEAESMEPT